MVLRTLLGDGPAELLPRHILRPGQVVLAGARSLDPGEREYVAATGIPVVDPDSLITTLARTGARTVYLHIDLDVLDPEWFASVGTPEPDGWTPAQLIGAVQAIADRFPIAGLGITEYEPSRGSDRTILKELTAAIPPAL
jgi:arginase family enzyme